MPVKELTDTRSTLKRLQGRKKLQYIWDYYKLPLVVIGIAVYILCCLLHGALTHRDTVLTAALVNVTAGDELTAELSEGYLTYLGADPDREQVELWTGLNTSEELMESDTEYAYASGVKLLAGISSEQLDVLLMDEDTLTEYAKKGYLTDLSSLLSSDPELLQEAEPYFYTSYGLSLSCSPMMEEAGYDGEIFLGVVSNSGKKDSAVKFIDYLLHN